MGGGQETFRAEDDSAYINMTSLCGVDGWQVWDARRQDFGHCFLDLALMLPTQALLAVVSAYYLGFQASQWYLRTKLQKYILLTRSLAALLLTLLPLGSSLGMYLLHRPSLTAHGEAGLLSGAVQSLSWALHLMYTYLLHHRLSLSVRGPRPAILAWLLALAANIAQARSQVLAGWHRHTPEEQVIFATGTISAICLAIYLFSLLPAGDQRPSEYQDLRAEAADPLLDPRGLRSHHSYGGFLEAADPHYLGVAKDRAPFLNRLLFRWVDPLIAKACRGRLNHPDDVFDLPEEMTTHEVAGLLRKQAEQLAKLAPVSQEVPRLSLVRLLFRCFGRQFFTVGLLKLLNDCSGFAGPLLLHAVVSFMENPGQPVGLGYLWAFLLALSSLVSALASCHFNLLMAELGVKVRAAMTTSVYTKTVGVTRSSLASFTTGEIINFMSVDTDRIVNFCPSLHAAWSLPFQFIVTLILLYQQVGVSFLSGLVFTIAVIPVNKCIASKIGTLSERMMTAKDKRVNMMSELLTGIRVIKYFNWQHFFSDRVEDIRKEELKQLAGRKYLDALCVYLWATTPVLISVLTFVTYVLLGNTLTAAKVFTSVALFAMLTGPLNAFPWVLNGLVESLVSIRRLEAFFCLPETSPGLDPSHQGIHLSGASFLHKPEERPGGFRLDSLTVELEVGGLLGVMGTVGSGKSSLLAALLGELEGAGGAASLGRPRRGVGYVAQEPWLQAGSIRDNILFGKAYQHTWYHKVVEACALKTDFDALTTGDQARVGEGGNTLSGGQRARVALARAVYQDKELYLIDDIFSAVDGHVAAHIYRKVILGLLKDKTRVLCTHQTRYLQGADHILVLEDGRIETQGPPGRVLPLVTGARLLDQGLTGMIGTPMDTVVQSTGRNSPTQEDLVVSTEPVEEAPEERRETGRVRLEVYRSYWRAVGLLLSPTILLSLLAMQVTRNMTDLWLADWVGHNGNTTQPNISVYSHDPNAANVQYYLTVYGSIAVANSLFSFMRAFLFAFGGVCAARTIHTRLLKSVIRGKVVFFDTTPVGQILNRFSSDLCTVDDSLPFILNIFLANFFGVIGPLLVTVWAVPWLLLILLPLSAIYLHIQHRYRPASRDLKRIGSVTLSPIYSHFSETLAGVTTVRAMAAVPRFVRESEERVEALLRTQYSGQAASQWLELRLQLLGCGVVGGVAVIAVIQHHTGGADPGLVGLAISYALGITGKLSGLVTSFTETERELVAVERVGQYVDKIEPEQVEGSITSPYHWPSEGIVTLKNVKLRYQDHLPWALNSVSLQTKAGEKVGIVGRTGSGKSSIFHALFRLTEVSAGEIYIDTVNTRLLDLEELREQLIVIPQDPFLFTGTVRENLDPVNFCSDRQLLDALRKARLEGLVDRLGGLDAALDGTALSAGQKQLFCLARAVLSPAKVVMIDEATANVDTETDNQIQQVIESCLSDRTVLTIAHRVDTILGCDRVLVMENGCVVEAGHPNILLQDSQTRFSKFANSR